MDQEKIKVDFLTGFRYWHISNSLTFSPSVGLNFSNSLNWVESGNISPNTTSRIISDWERTGAVRKHRGKLLLRVFDQLAFCFPFERQLMGKPLFEVPLLGSEILGDWFRC